MWTRQFASIQSGWQRALDLDRERAHGGTAFASKQRALVDRLFLAPWFAGRDFGLAGAAGAAETLARQSFRWVDAEPSAWRRVFRAGPPAAPAAPDAHRRVLRSVQRGGLRSRM